MIARCPVRKVRVGQRKGQVVDDAYRAFIRRQACICCGSQKWIECAHVGPRGLGQKCSDYETLPLCPAHHLQGPQSHHVLGKRFWIIWRLDRFALIGRFNRMYEDFENRTRALTAEE
jgi:hypothetical protein